jgi:hypothetical protein
MNNTNPEAQDQDWALISTLSFAQDWDNAEDAIYDDWREYYLENLKLTDRG